MQIRNDKDLRGMQRIGQICGLTLKHMLDRAEPGMSTRDLDDIGGGFLLRSGAASAPISAYRFPGYTCISLNAEAAHGVPSEERILQAGDLLNVDVSAELEGYWGDTGATIILPPAKDSLTRLCEATRRALYLAIDLAKPGQRTSGIGKAVERYAKRHGYRTLRHLSGHGVGGYIHEPPTIPNFNNWRNRETLRDGMVVTLEPFFCVGRGHIKQAADGWTLLTVDGSLSAQYEHTVIIDGDSPILVTQVDGGYA